MDGRTSLIAYDPPYQVSRSIKVRKAYCTLIFPPLWLSSDCSSNKMADIFIFSSSISYMAFLPFGFAVSYFGPRRAALTGVSFVLLGIIILISMTQYTLGRSYVERV